MAAPNLVSPTTTYGRTTGTNIGTAITVLVSNPSGSNKAYKLNSLYVANIDDAQTAKISVDFYRATNSIRIIDRIDVSAGDTLVGMSSDTLVYLEEGDSLRCYANQNNLLHVVLSYEVIG